MKNSYFVNSVYSIKLMPLPVKLRIVLFKSGTTGITLDTAFAFLFCNVDRFIKIFVSLTDLKRHQYSH